MVSSTTFFLSSVTFFLSQFVLRLSSEKSLHQPVSSFSFRDALDGAPGSRTGLFHELKHCRSAILSLKEAGLCGLVAQSVEQRPFKPLVLGSSPSQPTTLKRYENT